VLISLTGIALDPDGDLLRYKDGMAQEEPHSQTMQALLAIAPRLNMDKTEIYRDLLQEKSPAFEQSPLYKKLFALAPTLPRACVPEIVLTSPEIHPQVNHGELCETGGGKVSALLEEVMGLSCYAVPLRTPFSFECLK